MPDIIGRKFKTLSEIYSVLPEVDCVGRCAATCTFIPMSNVERRRVAAKGFVIPLIDDAKLSQAAAKNELPPELQNTKCPALTIDRRCAAHDVRPLICRLYGVTEDMRCPFGCEVSGALVTAEEAHWLLDETRRIGGGSTVLNRRRKENLKKRRR